MAVMSLEQRTAVGSSLSAIKRSMAPMPPSMVWSPSTTCSGGTASRSSVIDLLKDDRLAPRDRGAQTEWSGEEGDGAMAERGQMLQGLPNSLAIVHFDYADVGQVWSRIHEDQRELAFHQPLHQILFDAEGHDGHAVHVALQHAANQRLGASRFVVGGTDQHLIPLGDSKVFKLLD